MAELSAYEGKLYWDPGTGAVLLGQVRDIEGPGVAQDAVDVASRDSGKLTAYLGGLRSGGEVSFEIVYDPDDATHGALTAALLAGTEGHLYLLLRELTETGWHGCAVVKAFKPKAPLQGGLAADAVFEMLAGTVHLGYLTDGDGDYMVDGNSNYWVA